MLATGIAILFSAAQTSAALIAEDSFLIGGDASSGEYTVGGVGGQNPTTTGFTGAWNNVSDDLEIVSSGLTYSNGGGVMQTSGGALKAEADGVRVARTFSTVLDGSSTGTYYLGFLYQQADTSEGFRGITLYNGSPGSSNRDFMFRPDSATAGQWNIDAFGNDQTNVAPSNSDVNFILMKFDMSSSAASDSLSVYLNPDLATEPSSGAIYSAGSLDIAFDRMGMERYVPSTGEKDRDIWMDEIRLGDSYESVTTIPEPGSLALVTAGIVAALGLRRFRRG